MSKKPSPKSPTKLQVRTSPQSQQTAKMGTNSSKTPPKTPSERTAPKTRAYLYEEESKDVKEEREKSLNTPLEEKRKHYKCGRKFNTLDNVPTWKEIAESDAATSPKKKKNSAAKVTGSYEAKAELNVKVSIWKGDITTLEIDAIVNAANESLLGGGGVDGAIHSAAGPQLKKECAKLHGCATGDAKITAGYKLPAKYVIHTVGPIGQGEKDLRNCYTKSLELMRDNRLTSIAFPCISTGIYGYPNDKAADLAMKTVREWLENEEYGAKVERVIFCLFLPVDVGLYNEGMKRYFPLPGDGSKDDGAEGGAREGKNVKDTKMEVDSDEPGKEKDEKNRSQESENDVEMVDKQNVNGNKRDNTKGDNPGSTKGDNSENKSDLAGEKMEEEKTKSDKDDTNESNDDKERKSQAHL